MPYSPAAAENRFLRSLPEVLLARLEPHLGRMRFELGVVLHERGAPIRHVHFPLDCLISHTITMDDGKTAEVATVGQREFAGTEALLGDGSAARTSHVVQIPGECLRASTEAVRQLFDEDARFRAAMLVGVRGRIAQSSQNAACNALHSLEQRLARWLLECHSRVPSDQLRITQQFLSVMLGVRRAGVSEAIGRLEERKLVAHRRGSTTILDAEGLEAISCECYRVLLEDSERQLGALAGQAA